MTNRKFLKVNGIQLSYIDHGGYGAPLLALHGHFGCSRTFSEFAEALGKEWRVIALDQRGHGWSDKPEDYSREAYIKDLTEVIEHLGIAPAVVLGHSLGGLNAYQLAAQHPELVRALIVEDIGANTTDVPVFVPDWPARFNSVKQALDILNPKGSGTDPYFLESLTEYADGWGFRFQYEQMINSQRLIIGDWSQDWHDSKCPALLLHGQKSWALKSEHAREMAEGRPNTWLVEFPDAGHVIHNDEPEEFCKTVKIFLDKLSQE